MNMLLILAIVNLVALWIGLLAIYIIYIKFKFIEKKMIENTKELLLKVESFEPEEGKKWTKI